ncbi:SIS domain-containing protein [Paenibacillus alginolyticus]
MSTQTISNHVQQALEAMKNRVIQHVFFVACGGSSALMYPSKYVMDREAKTIRSDLFSSNEFIYRNPQALDEKSLVILCSLSGTTPETVEAAKFARSKGALTVSLTNVGDSPLAQASDYPVVFAWGEGTDPAESNASMMYQLVFGLLHHKESNDKFNSYVSSLSLLESIFSKAWNQFKPNAKEFAESYKKEKVIYTMASGSNFGPAYALSICYFLEMQWIHSAAIHAGEYFHGPFEILDKDVPFFIILGLDETRPMEERALEFTKRYGHRIVVLDAKQFDLEGIDEGILGYVAAMVISRVTRLYAMELAAARNHPLTTRRYMWKVEY